jgi:hypothetical protein
MPSRADWRRASEWACRVALVIALGVALWRSVKDSGEDATSVSMRASEPGAALERAATSSRVSALRVEVNAALPARQLAWLSALRRAGVRVSWSGSPPALAIAADRLREPRAPALLRLVADNGSSIVISDSVGVIDSVRAPRGATLDASDVTGIVTARHGQWTAQAHVPDPEERRDVLVLGRASWESRFVLDALGEAGWNARARLPVAPGVSVIDASLLPLDTARYDAVIALDSSAADMAGAVTRFAAEGGGVIVVGSALEIGALRTLASTQASERRPGRILLEGDALTRADLPLRPLRAVSADAVVLDRQPAGIAVVIRRAGRARVAAIGYDESWRWRMQGGAGGAPAHRAWWSRMVGLVAPARPAANQAATQLSGGAAPRAALVEALGPASATPTLATRSGSTRLPLGLLAMIAALLLAETASRRFHGAS